MADGSYSDTVKIAVLPKVREQDKDTIPKLYLDVFKDVLKGVEDLPLLVVSVTGEFRSGKSFLLNLLTIYLELREKVCLTLRGKYFQTYCY